MILIDSNVPMYLVGGEHPNKPRAQLHLELLVKQGERLVTDAEVFQEILHRYVAIRRTDAIAPAFAVLRGLVDEVFEIGLAEVERAKEIVTEGAPRSARDAIHLAVMERRGVERIFSFDRGFDGVPGVVRLP